MTSVSKHYGNYGIVKCIIRVGFFLAALIFGSVIIALRRIAV